MDSFVLWVSWVRPWPYQTWKQPNSLILSTKVSQILKYIIVFIASRLRGKFKQTDWRGIFAVFQWAKIKGEVWQTSPSVGSEVSNPTFTSTQNKLTLKHPKALKSPSPSSFTRKTNTNKKQSTRARHGVALLAVWNAGLMGKAGIK